MIFAFVLSIYWIFYFMEIWLKAKTFSAHEESKRIVQYQTL